jgi:dephospho-CoA kinase
MKHVGLTGGIGSGKTTVAQVFEQLGVPVFYSDSEAKKLYETDVEIKNWLNSETQSQAFDQSGKLNTNRIAELIFSNEEKLKQFNALVHPKVRKAFNEWAEKQKTSYVIIEAAILVETGRYKDLDALICVSAPEELRIDRVLKRNQISKDVVKQRISHQMTDEQRLPFCTFVIENDDKSPLIPQILDIHAKLLK